MAQSESCTCHDLGIVCPLAWVGIAASGGQQFPRPGIGGGGGGRPHLCYGTSESGYPHYMCIVDRTPVGGQKMTPQNVPLWYKDYFKLKINEKQQTSKDLCLPLFCTGKGKRIVTTGDS